MNKLIYLYILTSSFAFAETSTSLKENDTLSPIKNNTLIKELVKGNKCHWVDTEGNLSGKALAMESNLCGKNENP